MTEEEEQNADKLYSLALSNRYSHGNQLDNKQWNCLVVLIEDGDIKTLEQLKEYMEIKDDNDEHYDVI